MEPETIDQTLEDATRLRVAAMQLADTLDAEMTAPEHEHARGSLVRRLGVLVEEYATGYAAILQAGEGVSVAHGLALIKLAETDAARAGWRKLAIQRGRQIDGLSAKLVRRAAKLGRLRKANKFLAAEIARVEAELEEAAAHEERLIGHLRTRGAELKAERRQRRNLAAEVTRLRRRLRDSNLRKLTLAFGEGGMFLDAGSKVAEPVNSETDRGLLEAIEREVAWAMATASATPAAGARRVLDALRSVGR